MKRWLRAIGFYRGFLLVSFMPMGLGTVLAWQAGAPFDGRIFLATMVGVWLLHAGSNLLNDYFDHLSGTDDRNPIQTPFSGGTRVIQEGLLPPAAIRTAGFVAYGAGIAVFLALAPWVGWRLLGLAAFGLLVGWSYTAQPIRLAYRGWGELFIGLVFGPAIVLTGYYAQTREFSLVAGWTGAILGLWTAAIITINELPDYDADRQAAKRNLVVRFGRRFGLRLWAALLYVGFAALVAGIFLGVLPAGMVLGVLALPLVVRLVDGANPALENLDDNIRVCARTIQYEIAFWALLAGGLIAGRLLGAGA